MDLYIKCSWKYLVAALGHLFFAIKIKIKPFYFVFITTNSWCVVFYLYYLPVLERTEPSLLSLVTYRSIVPPGSPPARPTRLASPQTTSSPAIAWRWRSASASCSPSSPDPFCERWRDGDRTRKWSAAGGDWDCKVGEKNTHSESQLGNVQPGFGLGFTHMSGSVV